MGYPVELTLNKYVVEVQEDMEFVSRTYFDTLEEATKFYDSKPNFQRWLVLELRRHESL